MQKYFNKKIYHRGFGNARTFFLLAEDIQGRVCYTSFRPYPANATVFCYFKIISLDKKIIIHINYTFSH
jgi:hypothetical protein